MHAISRRKITASAVLRCDLIFTVIGVLTTLGIAPGSAAAEASPQPAGYAINGVDTSRCKHSALMISAWRCRRSACGRPVVVGRDVVSGGCG
jgi:hypothetical protein